MRGTDSLLVTSSLVLYLPSTSQGQTPARFYLPSTSQGQTPARLYLPSTSQGQTPFRFRGAST